MAKPSEKDFKALPAQRKVEQMRGYLRNFSEYCRKGLLRVMQESRPDFNSRSTGYKKIFDAFMNCVEGFLSLTGDPGGTFTHLPQEGTVTQTEYELLGAEAAHLAGVLFDHVGYKNCAVYAHAECSRYLAKAKLTSQLLEKHLKA